MSYTFSPLIAPRPLLDTSRPGDMLHDDARPPRHGGRWLGAAVAAGLLLVFLLQGGHPPSNVQELAWLSRLAAVDNPDARLQLGLAYDEGRYGLVPDALTGQYWFKRASRNGQVHSADLLADWSVAGNAGAARARVHSRLDALATQLKSPVLVTVSALWKILGFGLTGHQLSGSLQQRAHTADQVAEFQLAMQTLAEVYRTGTLGVTRNLDKAAQWQTRAAAEAAPHS